MRPSNDSWVDLQFGEFYSLCILGFMHPGWYPIAVMKKGWYVDHWQSYPKLHVTQRQLHLCPAFSGMAKFAPGQNLGCVFADVNIADGTSAQTCYIAISQVKTRENISLLRSFPRSMFCKENGRTPELLLQHLRREEIDWDKHQTQWLEASPCQWEFQDPKMEVPTIRPL